MKLPTLPAVALIAIASTLPAPAESGEKILFDFQKDGEVQGWAIEDDGVMGGVSKGTFRINDDGHAEFAGEVSLDNDGGFSSLQWNFDPIAVQDYSTFVIRLRGDGKRYLLLTESKPGDRHYYQAEFQTGTDWQTIEIPFKDMTPHFRGDRLDQPNFEGKTMAQVRFMIANGKAESFRLEIDKVELR
jgi:NADH dehydrogenase [ubiquinone] 1 alpha subcomplex assembly factor 1